MKPFVVTREAQVLESFGDVDFLEYGGQLLLQGKDGDEWVEVIEPPCEDDLARLASVVLRWTVYRFEPERLKWVRGYLVPLAYESGWPQPLHLYEEWFGNRLDYVAESMDLDLEDFQKAFASEDACVRARAWIEVGHYFGWHELDHYPLELSQHEAYERYGELESCKCEKCQDSYEAEIR